MKTIITILDGYIDEPSTLGVPPFLAPLPRYVFGAIKSASKDIQINYLTIDEYRLAKFPVNNGVLTAEIRKKLKCLNNSKMLILIAGAIVPGKYLSGTPISYRETLEIAQLFDGVKFFGGPSARSGFQSQHKDRYRKRGVSDLKSVFDHLCTKDLDAGVYDYLSNNDLDNRYRSDLEWSNWSFLGSELVTQHPNFPNALMLELEGSRGCVRYFTGGCSFCSEPSFGVPRFRPPEDIISEVKKLNEFGVKNFRLGALSCIFSYWSKGIGETETPTPNPKMVEKLLTGITKAAPNLEILHLDNANPAVMAEHIHETKRILKTIIQTCTGGNILSFGLESADPKVMSANNLNTNPEQVIEMVKLVNHFGSSRSETGMPMLLPGLNLVHGLIGESKETFRLNFEFLKSILDQDLLLRRINLRQVLPVKLDAKNKFRTKKYHHEFVRHKKMVRENIDRTMLKRMIPTGTVLKDVYTQKMDGDVTFARQLGTYPLVVGIKYPIPLNNFYDIVITDFGYRSITGFASPFKINKVSEHAMQALPGIGRKRAIRLLKFRPFNKIQDIYDALDDESVINDIKDHISFE